MTIFTRALLATALAFGLPGAAANAQRLTIGSDATTNRAVTVDAFEPIGQSFTASPTT